MVSPSFTVLPTTISNCVNEPISFATDPYGDVYVGNDGNGGNVTNYQAGVFTLVQTITANKFGSTAALLTRPTTCLFRMSDAGAVWASIC